MLLKVNRFLLMFLIIEVCIKGVIGAPATPKVQTSSLVFKAPNIAKVSYVNDVPRTAKKALASRSSNEERMVQLIGGVVCRESCGEPNKGKLAVATVVLNRLDSGKYGTSLSRIIFAPRQFAFTEHPCKACMKIAMDAVDGKRAFGKEILYFWNPRTSTDKRFLRTVEVRYEVGHHVFGVAKGAE